MRSRIRPSGLKIQLLSHMQECLSASASKCEDNRLVLEAVTSPIPMPLLSADAPAYECLDHLRERKEDLTYLAGQLREKAEMVDSLSSLIRRRIDLSGNYRNSIIALLVAVYAPMAL